MRRVSKKRAKLISESREFRSDLCESTGACMICSASPARTRYAIQEMNQLCCHEILNGPYREKVLKEPSCLLVLCWHCNQEEVTDKSVWPVARQLAVLKKHAIDRYDLRRFLELRNPNAMRFLTEEDVDCWLETV